jgi:hypothetical protein
LLKTLSPRSGPGSLPIFYDSTKCRRHAQISPQALCITGWVLIFPSRQKIDFRGSSTLRRVMDPRPLNDTGNRLAA